MPKLMFVTYALVAALLGVVFSLEGVAEAFNPPQATYENPMKKKLPGWVYEVDHYWYIL